MTPAEYKALKAQAKAAAEAVEVAKVAQAEADRALQEAHCEEYRLRQEIRKWEPLTPAQKKALLFIYRAGGVMWSGWFRGKTSYCVPTPREAVLPVVAEGLISRQCLEPSEQGGIWGKQYRLSEHGEALARQIEQEGE